mgnify:CR=1 FL=1
MQRPPDPEDEQQRLDSLQQLNILDSEPEERFDRLTRLARSFFDVPIALVSLVDSHRQWFKSRQGLDACETPREISFCGHAILSDDIFYIADTLKDSRFADNPLVTDAPHIRSYVGAPLKTAGGHRIGTLCIIDDKPRDFTQEQLAHLRDLADCVEGELQQQTIDDANRIIQEKETRLEAVVHTVVDGIMVVDISGRIQTVNPAAERLFDSTEQSMIDEEVGNFIPSLHIEKGKGSFKSKLDALIHDSEEKNLEFSARTRSGGLLYIEFAVNEMELNGNLLYTIIVRDITQRKKSEEDIHRYIDALERLHKITADIKLDTAGRLQAILETGREIFKLPLGIISRIIREQYKIKYVTGPEWAPPAETEFELGGTYCVHTLSAKRPTGFHHAGTSEIKDHPCYKSFGLESYIGVPIMVSGQLYGTLNYSAPEPRAEPFSETDFSLIQLFSRWIGSLIEQERINKELGKETVLRQAILDSANLSIISTDINGVIRSFNRAAEKMLGYSAKELVGKAKPDIFHDSEELEERARVLSWEQNKQIAAGMEVLLEKASKGEADEQQWSYVRKNGSQFQIMLSVTVLRNKNGRITGYLFIGSDITERLAVDKLKSEFISTVSHELRTPLTSIMGAIGVVLSKASEGMSEKARRLLTTARRNSEHLTLLINDILDLEKIESGKLEFEIDELDLVTFSNAAVEANQEYATQKGISLEFNTSLETARVMADSHRLMQVYNNFISNAVKFSPQGAKVVIKVEEKGNLYRVCVQDFGRGIPEEFRSRVFESFAQVDSSDSREKEGTGLGLSICRAIVERMNGRIDYTSRIGEGSQFFFELPKHHSLTILKKDPDADARILICEDNHDVANVLSEILSLEGYKSDQAHTAGHTLDLLKQNNYQLLLLDLNLPDMDGIELLRKIRSNKVYDDLKVVVISVRAEEGRKILNGDAINVVDWIQKPVDQERLSHVLEISLHDDEQHNVLHVEDDVDIIQVTRSLLADSINYTYATSLAKAREELKKNTPDLVLLDMTLPDGSGLDLLNEIRGTCPVIIFSAIEPEKDVAEKTDAILNKSRISNDELLVTIKQVLNG